MPQDRSNLIWVDLEMTGLDTDRDSIIEVATVVTDASLQVVAEGPVFAVHQSDETLARMDEWNTRQHGASGLTERVRQSSFDEATVEQRTLEFLALHVPAGASPMCGNSVCMDRRFLARCMPRLEAYFHYRLIDVSTLKELCSRWAPGLFARLSKRGKHRALDDIHDSIAELRFYREHFLRLP